MAMQRIAKTSDHVTCKALNSAAATETTGERLLFTGCYTDSTPFLFGTAGKGILAFSVRPLSYDQSGTDLHWLAAWQFDWWQLCRHRLDRRGALRL